MRPSDASLVSVIVPAFNREDVVLDTLNSVVAQTYRPIELIVIDDGSTDHTVSVVREFIDKQAPTSEFHARLIAQSKGTANRARNAGLQEARGEYLIFLDSDDILSANALKSQVECLKSEPRKTAVYSKWFFFYLHDNGITLYEGLGELSSRDPLDAWLRDWFAPPVSILWRKADVTAIGGWDESVRADGDDAELMMRFFLNGGALKHNAETCVFYRQHRDPSRSLASSRLKSDFESRYSVIAKVRQELERRGNVERYKEALALRLSRLADRSALPHPELANRCIAEARSLSGSNRLPKVFRHQVLVELLGITRKQRYFQAIRNFVGIERKAIMALGGRKIRENLQISDLVHYC